MARASAADGLSSTIPGMSPGDGAVDGGPAVMHDDANERYVIRAADRALTVLVLLAKSPAGLDISAIARSAKLPTSTVFRILQTLRLRGFAVETPTGSYRIGPRAFEVGSSFLQGTSLRSQGEALVESIAAETGETASLGILDSDEVLYIAIAHGQRELGIQSAVGARHPVYCTALGKVLLADLNWPEASALLARVDREALTPNTMTDLDRWQDQLSRVAQQGYALDLQERILGVHCAAAPVRDHSRRVIAAVSAAGPAFRINGSNLEHIIAVVQEQAAAFSRAIGYVP